MDLQKILSLFTFDIGNFSWKNIVMILVGLVLIYIAIK